MRIIGTLKSENKSNNISHKSTRTTMNLAILIISILTLIAAIFTVCYSYKTYTESHEPKLMLSRDDTTFKLQNIGNETAINISEETKLFANFNIPKLFDFKGPAPITTSSVSANISLVKDLDPGDKKNAIFNYQNLAGNSYRASFTIEKSTNTQIANPYQITNSAWQKLNKSWV